MSRARFKIKRVIEAARLGTALAHWAVREGNMRVAADDRRPVHVQYAGQGRIAVLTDGREVVWRAEANG